MELELKLLLAGSQEAQRLLASFKADPRLQRQRNLYFDDERGSWAGARVGLRLRWLDDRAVLTVKGPGTVRWGVSSRPEAEEEIDLQTAQRLAHGGESLYARAEPLLVRAGLPPFDHSRSSTLREIGSMRTTRNICELPREYVAARWLEVDETTYPDDSVVWEVEMEATPEAAHGGEFALDIERLRRHFQDVGLRWRPSSLSKRERLERSLRRRSS